MFTVDEATAAAIRRAYEEDGELAGAVELRRHFPLITDNEHARRCVRMIASWEPIPEQTSRKAAHRGRSAPKGGNGGGPS
jgi:hypothetical protein